MLRYVQKAADLIGRAESGGQDVREEFEGTEISVEVTEVEGEEGSTEYIDLQVPGRKDSPVLGVIGRLGGAGARPSEIGLVSDADGALVAVAAALRFKSLLEGGDQLPSPVIIRTHVCPDAPTQPHEPVPFMGSPLDTQTMIRHEVDERMDAILSIDATKGNRVHCRRGFAITPTVKEGWILKVSDDLMDVQERVTGEQPSTLTITMQDITPYGNDISHINSIMQPSVLTSSPVVGVATTSAAPVAGCGTGANYIEDLSYATQFIEEIAKDYARDRVRFYDEEEFERIKDLYGPMNKIQKLG